MAGVAKAVVVFSSSPSVPPALPTKEAVEDTVMEEPEAQKQKEGEEAIKEG